MPPDRQLAHLSSPEFIYGQPPEEQNKCLQGFVRPHIESFNYFLETGLNASVQDIPSVYIILPDKRHAELSFQDASIGTPTVDESCANVRTVQVYPSEARERHTTYKAKLQVTVKWSIDGVMVGSVTKPIADVPIMVKSKNCSLFNLSPAELVARHEEAEEWGGYFVVNGNEKLIRMLIMPRRNYPLAMIRQSWRTRGPLFTEFGVTIRNIKHDQTGNTNVLHFLLDGTCSLSFVYKKEQFYVPLAFMLRVFSNASDQQMFRDLTHGREDDPFFKDAVSNMFRQLQSEKLFTADDVMNYMGERFRVKLNLPPWLSNLEVAKFLLNSCVLIHLQTNVQKYHLLMFMCQKLFSLANNKCAAESPDNPMNQEILQGGHIYQMILKDKLESWLSSLKSALERYQRRKPDTFDFTHSTILNCMQYSMNVGQAMEYFMATGNVVSNSGLGLMQANGFTVIADKLNFMRYLSHFRCVHRGAFFTKMRTTAVRKLLPEAWGFICPVNTPDGSPCGLLNHLAANVQVVNDLVDTSDLPYLLAQLGMSDLDSADSSDMYDVLLDGRLLGRATEQISKDLCKTLRYFKAMKQQGVPSHLEITFVPKTEVASMYPGVFLMSEPARMIRPVTNLMTKSIEYIGVFEQCFMDIAVCTKEIYEGVTTHIELSTDAMFSALATLTPFSNHNQSPRNIYQCQMGKQTMGTPAQALKHRSDNKMYRIQTPQAPLVKNGTYNQFGMDNWAMGTNAIVAVISYTGYDMEDAMIINKASLERGFKHGSVYKAQVVNLRTTSDGDSRGDCTLRFGMDPKQVDHLCKYLDADGLPFIGRLVSEGEPFYSYYDLTNQSYQVVKYKHMEAAYIDDVKALGNDKGTEELSNVCIKLRMNRNPYIGDKFASRHGQKGILSQKWPSENMPFSESGMQPDILFNPHGFPSRMTIGMMIESMAGKSAACHGITHDATAFKFTEDDPAGDYFGKMLVKAGYNYHGEERLYSGINGKELTVSIFMGVVYYQRLRHMVSDKFQVRTTGPVDNITQQPVQGRKRQGGIRFGEMERDALISHGAAFLLQDRLFHCSDKSTAKVCTACGSILTPLMKDMAAASGDKREQEVLKQKRQWSCSNCDSTDHIREIQVPYVFKYLNAELAAMNIKMNLEVANS